MTTPTDTAKLADEIEGLATEYVRAAGPFLPPMYTDVPLAEMSLFGLERRFIQTMASAAPTIISALRELQAAKVREAELLAELSASVGYMLNAKIDLETGATKATAIKTIDGGIRRARTALGGKG